MTKRTIVALSAAALMAGAPAFAQVAATAATDLNLRAGPAGDREILGVIPSGGEVQVQGCLEAANWCQVDFEGTQGWAYGEYLNATMAEASEPVAVIANREPLQIATVTAEDPVDDATDAAVGAGAGAALAAAIIGGPVAIAAGAALGAAAASADIDPAVTYVQQNPADPVVLEGEIVVGAGIPPEVEVIPVPDTQYSYLNVNGLPVIVDNESRQIVRIVR